MPAATPISAFSPAASTVLFLYNELKLHDYFPCYYYLWLLTDRFHQLFLRQRKRNDYLHDCSGFTYSLPDLIVMIYRYYFVISDFIAAE